MTTRKSRRPAGLGWILAVVILVVGLTLVKMFPAS